MTLRIKLFLTLIIVSFFSSAQVRQGSKEAVLDSVYSKILNDTRDIFIKLPRSYSENNKNKYPVAYILDGELLLSTLDLVHSYYNGGFLPEMILVGISNATNRTRDLTTSLVKGFNQENGRADNFMKFVKSELIPFVEKKYPVTNYRTLIGHSYGGLFTINALINHTELFENYLAIDPSLDWDNQKLLKQAKEVLVNKDLKNKSLFITLAGQLHMSNPLITIDNVMKDTTSFTVFPRSNIAFSKLTKKFAKNGLVSNWKFYPNDLHGTVPFSSIKDGLISMFNWYQWENTSAFNNPNTSIEKIREFVKHRENKLKSHFGYLVPPYGEDLFNALGYMNIEFGQLDKSLMYFEYAVKYYPNSANAYDSLADFYERKKDYVNALKQVTKAYNLSKKEYHKKRLDLFKSKI